MYLFCIYTSTSYGVLCTHHLQKSCTSCILASKGQFLWNSAVKNISRRLATGNIYIWNVHCALNICTCDSGTYLNQSTFTLLSTCSSTTQGLAVNWVSFTHSLLLQSKDSDWQTTLSSIFWTWEWLLNDLILWSRALKQIKVTNMFIHQNQNSIWQRLKIKKPAM